MDIMRGGTIEYKCRRCGKIDNSTHSPSAMQFLLAATNDSPTNQGIKIDAKYMTTIHLCDDNNLGVADLIGAELD